MRLMACHRPTNCDAMPTPIALSTSPSHHPPPPLFTKSMPPEICFFQDRRVSRDDCSSSTVSVFNNNTDQAEFYEHQTNKAEHRERVPAAGSEYYEKAKSQQQGGGEYYEQRKEQQQGSEYYAPLRLPVNCSTPEVDLRTTSHSVRMQMKMKEQSLTTNFIVNVRVFINCSQFKFAPLGIQNCAIQSNSSRTKHEKNPEDILLTISP